MFFYCFCYFHWVRLCSHRVGRSHLVDSNSLPSFKKGVLRNFEKFIGKHLCQSLFRGYRKSTPGCSRLVLKSKIWWREYDKNAIFLKSSFARHCGLVSITKWSSRSICSKKLNAIPNHRCFFRFAIFKNISKSKYCWERQSKDWKNSKKWYNGI